MQRTGWMSNSSSSSFILIGTAVDAKLIINEKYIMLGTMFSDGIDVIQLDDAMIDLVNKYELHKGYTIYKVIDYMVGDEGHMETTLAKKTIATLQRMKHVQIMAGEQDVCSTNTAAKFKEIYCTPED